MAIKTHTWISLWFLITAPVIIWDFSYCFMRPRSMKGGDLHWIWEPYGLYEEVDYIYGPQAYESGDGFTNAQSLLNVIETGMNILYLYFAHVAKWSPAIIIGFASAVMTLSKTVLYWAQEYFCGFCTTKQNNAFRYIFLWIIPNGLWIVVPSFIVVQLGKDLISALNTTPQKSSRAALGKRD